MTTRKLHRLLTTLLLAGVLAGCSSGSSGSNGGNVGNGGNGGNGGNDGAPTVCVWGESSWNSCNWG